MKKFGDMSLQEINEALDIVQLKEMFVKKFGEPPSFGIFGLKLGKWFAHFESFKEGAKAGRKTLWKMIMNSGWLEKGVQKEFEKQMEGDEDQIQTRKG